MKPSKPKYPPGKGPRKSSSTSRHEKSVPRQGKSRVRDETASSRKVAGKRDQKPDGKKAASSAGGAPIKKHPSKGNSRFGSRPAPSENSSLPEGVLHLYGLHTVRAALANPQRQKRKLLVTENALPRIEMDLPDPMGFALEFKTMAELDALLGPDAVHQGIVLECNTLNALDSTELFNLVDARLLLALDQITDPHNVGAILRSAVAMGVDAVLLTSRNSAVETGVLAKSASGALDMVKTVELRNLSKSLTELNDMGFSTIGLDSEGPMVLEDTLAAHKGKNICLVLGSEGKGLREKTRETCTALARLDMPGAIKSLNVSNAAALSLYLVASSQN